MRNVLDRFVRSARVELSLPPFFSPGIDAALSHSAKFVLLFVRPLLFFVGHCCLKVERSAFIPLSSSPITPPPFFFLHVQTTVELRQGQLEQRSSGH